MTAILVVVGALLVGAALVDVAWTTMAAGSGAGPITSRVARRSWQLAMAIFRRFERHVILTVAGVLTVFAVMATWIVLVLTGWTLIFSSAEGAVRSTSTGQSADLVDRVYFTGYTVFTLGIGDFSPGPGTWQLATVLATGTGLILVTLSITYLVPVASAVAQRRQLASIIASLGSTPQDILIGSWTGRGFGMLDPQLTTLTTLIQMGRHQHYTYPVLHYFHSAHCESAAAPNLANLSDALLLLQHGVAPEVRPDAGVLRSLDATMGVFLDTVNAAYIGLPDDPLPGPTLAPLEAAGIPVVGPDEFDAAVHDQQRRRRLLAGLLEDDGWSSSVD